MFIRYADSAIRILHNLSSPDFRAPLGVFRTASPAPTIVPSAGHSHARVPFFLSQSLPASSQMSSCPGLLQPTRISRERIDFHITVSVGIILNRDWGQDGPGPGLLWRLSCFPLSNGGICKFLAVSSILFRLLVSSILVVLWTSSGATFAATSSAAWFDWMMASPTSKKIPAPATASSWPLFTQGPSVATVFVGQDLIGRSPSLDPISQEGYLKAPAPWTYTGVVLIMLRSSCICEDLGPVLVDHDCRKQFCLIKAGTLVSVAGVFVASRESARMAHRERFGLKLKYLLSHIISIASLRAEMSRTALPPSLISSRFSTSVGIPCTWVRYWDMPPANICTISRRPSIRRPDLRRTDFVSEPSTQNPDCFPFLSDVEVRGE
ncbi:hypothetical protein D9758_017401 [Tetrapyrgos nigripes]|uniref:Uncharacterized protein n=1 Tax=Tetrapyrgos nigripes TaxID=182062 RepID=A0A8H5FEU6_9AGAR|nr:hypothetical protein D9758_017401 [Tetrapyrgos nigripes]